VEEHDRLALSRPHVGHVECQTIAREVFHPCSIASGHLVTPIQLVGRPAAQAVATFPLSDPTCRMLGPEVGPLPTVTTER
jgi:hypothetical protein